MALSENHKWEIGIPSHVIYAPAYYKCNGSHFINLLSILLKRIFLAGKQQSVDCDFKLDASLRGSSSRVSLSV